MSSEDLTELLAHPHMRKVVENMVLGYLKRLSSNERRNLWRVAKKQSLSPIPPRGYLTYKQASVKYNYQVQTIRVYVCRGLFTGTQGFVQEQSIIDYKPLYLQKRGKLNHRYKGAEAIGLHHASP